MRYMGEIKNRSVRLDQENYDWLVGLPGRSLNEAIERLRTQNGAEIPHDTAISEILELVRSLPDATDIEGVLRNVIQEFRAARTSSVPPSASSSDPATIPGVSRGMPPTGPTTRIQCEHCGEHFESESRLNKRCPGCVTKGHSRSRYNCEQCRLEA